MWHHKTLGLLQQFGMLPKRFCFLQKAATKEFLKRKTKETPNLTRNADLYIDFLKKEKLLKYNLIQKLEAFLVCHATDMQLR